MTEKIATIRFIDRTIINGQRSYAVLVDGSQRIIEIPEKHSLKSGEEIIVKQNQAGKYVFIRLASSPPEDKPEESALDKWLRTPLQPREDRPKTQEDKPETQKDGSESSDIWFRQLQKSLAETSKTLAETQVEPKMLNLSG